MGMQNSSLKKRIQRHIAFWKQENVDRPLMGFLIGSYFPVQRFEAAKEIMGKKTPIHPEEIIPAHFLNDYERLYSYSMQLEQDAFWAAEPFTGIPWMEAMLGCKIYGSKDSMWAAPILKGIEDFDKLPLPEESLWHKKYVEFTTLLSQRSEGRFPIGQPILRGISDMIGALVGQGELPFYFLDEPVKMKEICKRLNQVFLQVVEEQQENVPQFYGGYSIGFYDLWCPGKCIWFQEDLTSLLSPQIYREYILECNEVVCNKYEYSMMHLHPSSFYLLDDLLNIEGLKVIQINKDIGGPSVLEMVPIFKKVLEKKRLCIWGNLDEKDIYEIKSNLPYNGLYLSIVSSTVDEANALTKLINK